MMNKASKLLSSSVLAGSILALASGAAQAAPELSWQTAPILGTSTSYDGNVIVNTGPIPITIPHYSDVTDPLYHVGSPSMTSFLVGQTVDAGSGVDFKNAGDIYHWSVDYVGPTRTVSYADNYTGSSDLFVMNYADPVSTLTLADVGTWHYSEQWTNMTTLGPTLNYAVNFTVAVPEPETYAMMLAGLGLLGFIARRRKQKAA